VPYETAVDGIIAGIRDARTDFGVQCVLIAAINRMETPELGLEVVQTVLAHPREEVVGIGMDYAEAEHPPEKFWKAYRLAGERGLRKDGGEEVRQHRPARPRGPSISRFWSQRLQHVQFCIHVLNCGVGHGGRCSVGMRGAVGTSTLMVLPVWILR
jgi:adenosine deaminase